MLLTQTQTTGGGGGGKKSDDTLNEIATDILSKVRNFFQTFFFSELIIAYLLHFSFIHFFVHFSFYLLLLFIFISLYKFVYPVLSLFPVCNMYIRLFVDDCTVRSRSSS